MFYSSSLYLASSALFLQFCLVECQDCCNLDVLPLLIQPPRLFSMFFGMKSQHSTDSMFYSKQPLPRVFCALPPIVPTSCVKTLAMWMYCLYWFNHPDSFRCYLAWKVNIQLTLCSTPSSLFLGSSVLFLQSCLHHTSRLWQCGCIVFIASTTQTLFAVFWHEKSTFNWLYVLLQAASSSRLLCSSSNRAYIIRQESGNVDVLSLLAHHPDSLRCFLAWKVNIQLTLCSTLAASTSRLLCSSSSFASWCAKTVAIWMYCLYWFNHPDSFRCFLAWKVNIQLTVCFTPSSLFLASSVLFLQSCLHHTSRLWQCGCIVWIDSNTQTLSAVIWHEKSTFNWFYVLLQAASSSRLLCSSSNRAYIMRQDSGNVDVLSLLIQPPRLFSLLSNRAYIIRQDSGNVDVLSLLLQPPRLSSLFFGMKSQHSTDSMFYSKQPLPRVFCALPPIVPTSYVKTLAMWMYCLYWFNHPDSFRCYLAWKVNIQLSLCFTPSSLFLASSVLFLQLCLHHASRLWQCGCIVFIGTPPRLSSLFFGMKSQHSPDSMFYSKQPLPRVFCALPPIVPTSCVKTVAMWMYCLYCFNHPDSLRCFLAWKVNIQLTLCSTLAASFSRLLCSSSSFAYMVCQDSGNVDVLSSLIQSIRLSSLFLGMKVNIQLSLCSTLAASSSRLLCSSSSFAYMACQDCCNMDVMSPLVQSKHCSQLLSLKINIQLIHWLCVLL